VPGPDRQRGSAAVKCRFAHATATNRVLTPGELALACKRRTTSDPYWSDACAKLGRIHLPSLPRPPTSDKQARARYDSRALLASMNSTRKAALLRGLNDRVSRVQQYARVYQKVMLSVRARNRAQRKTTFSKIRAAVHQYATTGTVKAYSAFRRMERQNSGLVSATCSLAEVREGTKIICERCCSDLDIHATRDGHAVSLRQTLEMELLRYLQTGSSRAPRTNPEGKERTKTPAVIETRTVSKNEDPGANSSSAAASAGPLARPQRRRTLARPPRRRVGGGEKISNSRLPPSLRPS
jgi:hypothetical protein